MSIGQLGSRGVHIGGRSERGAGTRAGHRGAAGAGAGAELRGALSGFGGEDSLGPVLNVSLRKANDLAERDACVPFWLSAALALQRRVVPVFMCSSPRVVLGSRVNLYEIDLIVGRIEQTQCFTGLDVHFLFTTLALQR